jgi:tetratricopeptide (TPR) repeat protein
MKSFDIESYLDGQLSDDELKAFQQEMQENPAFARAVEQQRIISQHLRNQLLRAHVTAVLKERPPTGPARKWWLLGGTLLLLLVVFLLVFPQTRKDAPVPGETKKEIQPTAPGNLTPENVPGNPAPEPAPQSRPSQPIAANRPSGLRAPDYPAPNIRGQQDGNSAWQKTLDQLWFTQFPPQNTRFNAPFSEVAQLLAARDFPNAFVELEILEQQQAQNDTLRLLKAYCLLEMGEGAEALRYYDQLEGREPQWNAYLEWHRTLGLLATGEPKKALPKFRKMANTPGHPFQKQSLRALEVLK